MAKKKQTRAKSRPATKRVASHPFMETRQGDFAALLETARKGPQRDQSGSRFVDAAIAPGGKPGYRES
jgi:hypothetical protein